MEENYISEYLDFCESQKRLSLETIRAYNNDLNQFKKFDDIKEYVRYLCARYDKSKTIRRKLACVKSYYRYLENENIIYDNPFNKLYVNIKDSKELPKIISKNDLKKIRNHMLKEKVRAETDYKNEKSHRNLLILELLISTGIRISELCNLRLKQIDIEEQKINILGKGRKERTIYLGNKETLKLLETYIKTYRETREEYLFVGKDGVSHLEEQSVRLMFRNLPYKMGLEMKITPHMFRHTFATMLLESGVDIRYIQQILGHSSIAVTQIYTHVSMDKQREILTNLNPINQIQ